VSEHEPFVCVECERDEAIRERDEAIRERDEARKERDGWRMSEQETSREYHELRDLNTKVRSILMAPLDTTTDDAAWGVVHERDRLYAEVQKLTAERKDILDQRDEARQQRDEAQKLAVERGELIEGLKHDLKRADFECSKAWEHRDALASRFRSIDRVLLIETSDAQATLQAVQKVVTENRKAVLDLEDLRRQWVSPRALADTSGVSIRERARTRVPLDGFEAEVLEASLTQAEGERDKLREEWVEPRDRAGLANATVRRCARSRVPIDGAEAQALEGALALTERERDEACSQRDQAREQSSKLVEELERTKTLLAEDRAELKELRDSDKKTAEELSHVIADLSASHSLVAELRSIVGAGVADATRDAVRRVVAERDAAVSDLAEQRRREAEQHKNWDQLAREVLEILHAGPMEGMLDAARRVAVERDEALQHARDAEQAIKPTALPPGLRWDWSGSAFDGSGRWEVLCESLIVARAEKCRATGTTPAGWRWQRLDGTRDWGIEDDEHTALSALARHLREHPPLAAAVAAPAESEPVPELDPLLPSVLRWVRRETSSELVFWEVLYESLIVGRIEQCRARGPLLGWWIWERLDGAREQGAEPDALKARGKLARHLREHPPLVAADPAEPAPAPELPPGLRWVRYDAVDAPSGWYVQMTDGSNKMVGRVDQSIPPNGGSRGWRWQRLGQPVTGRPTWGDTPTEYEARAALARYLCAVVTDAKLPADAFTLPLGMHWRRVGTVVMQVTDDRGHVVGEVVPGVPPGWSWWASGGPAFAYPTGGVAPSEFDARDALAAAVREAHGPSEQADAPASPEQPPSETADSTETSLPKGLYWVRVGSGPWMVLRRFNGEPMGRAWYDEQQKGWRWEFAKSGNGEGFFSTAEQARSRLALALRVSVKPDEALPSEPPDPLALPPGLVWMKWLEDGAWNWGVYRDGSPLGRLLAKVMKHQSLRDVWYWILYGYVIDDDSQGIIDGPCWGSQYNARVALAALLRRIGAGLNG
jgi:hypothetical protein